MFHMLKWASCAEKWNALISPDAFYARPAAYLCAVAPKIV
jgi:hypothetical protein